MLLTFILLVDTIESVPEPKRLTVRSYFESSQQGDGGVAKA